MSKQIIEPTGIVHKLKTWPIFFEAILNGTKTFEVRYNDRRFQVGDRLDLLEFDLDALENGAYTGRHCHRFVSYILDSNPFIDLQGYAILGLSLEQSDDKPSDELDNSEIYKWLEDQKYQTDYSGEYRMYFGIDMPKILRDYAKYIKAIVYDAETRELMEKYGISDQMVKDYLKSFERQQDTHN